MDSKNGVLHEGLSPPARLAMLAALNEVDEMDFKSLRVLLDTSDSVTSKHITTLEELGFVTVRKGFVGKRPRTWVAATKQGRKAFSMHRRALLNILGK